jgi:hypothetical protein
VRPRTLARRLTVVIAGAALLTAPVAATAQEAAAYLTVVHALRGENLDIYERGFYDDPLIGGFEPGEVTHPPLPVRESGEVELEVYLAADDPDDPDRPVPDPDDLLDSFPVYFDQGARVSAVIYRDGDDAEGQVGLRTFANDESLTGCEGTRLAVRNVTGVGDVEVRLDVGEAPATVLVDGGELVQDLPAGEATIEVVDVDSGDELGASLTLELEEGDLTTVWIAAGGVVDTFAADASGDVEAAQVDEAVLLYDRAEVGAEACDPDTDPEPEPDPDPEPQPDPAPVPDPDDPQDDVPPSDDPDTDAPDTVDPDTDDPDTDDPVIGTPDELAEMPVPTRVDSGSGGLATTSTWPLLAGTLAGAALLAGAFAGRRRRPAAPTSEAR